MFKNKIEVAQKKIDDIKRSQAEYGETIRLKRKLMVRLHTFRYHLEQLVIRTSVTMRKDHDDDLLKWAITIRYTDNLSGDVNDILNIANRETIKEN